MQDEKPSITLFGLSTNANEPGTIKVKVEWEYDGFVTLRYEIKGGGCGGYRYCGMRVRPQELIAALQLILVTNDLA